MTSDDARRRRLETFRTLAAERLAQVSLGWIELEHGAASPARTEAMLRELHTLKGEAGLMGFGAVADALHELEDLIGTAVRRGAPVDPSLGDLVLRGLDQVGAAIAGDAEKATAEMNALRREAHDAGPAPAVPRDPRPPTMPPPFDPPAAPSGGGGGGGAPGLDEPTSRISIEQLERISGVVSELVLVRHRLADAVGLVHRQRLHAPADETLTALHGRLRDDVRRMAAMTASLDAVVRDLRMVPIERLLAHFPLMVRELARDLGKQVKLVLVTNGVQADRAILEHLQGPLLHLIRNAVDHGIEPPADRVAAGKPETGTITIAASVVGSTLRLEIRDDGAGIDVDVVRRRAVEQGLIEAPSARVLSDEQILAYLFSSGFSTRKTVTRVSGRGVGLDVVRSAIEAVGGTVTTHNAPGRGTTFVLNVPVTALITPLVLATIGAGRYAIPSAEVVSILPADDHPVVDSIDGPAIRLGDALVPLVPLPEILGEPDAPPVDARLVIARSGEVLMALAGTTRHRDREAVIRGAGPVLDGNPYIAGGIDLEDGSVALVLDLSKMVVAARAIAVRARHHAAPVTTAVAAKVLVVEDSVIMRDIIAEALRAHGVEVVEAEDGVEALAALELHPDVRLLVTDLEMPRLDGFELIRRVRAQPRSTRLPAVVISTRGSDADKLAAIEVGADAYLVKSDFSRESLWSHIGRFLVS